MPKFDKCGHIDGRCPCLDCWTRCGYRCTDETEIAVDTSKLCERARKYCESGMDEDDRSDSQGTCPGSN